MLRQDNFFENEREAPLLIQEKGYLEDLGVEKAINRTAEWPSLVGIDKEDEIESFETEQPDRIFIRDAERTFLTEENRNSTVNMLVTLNHQLGDYHQALCYVASFMRLTLDKDSVVKIILKLAHDSKYIPQVWKGESVAASIDSYVFFELLKERLPKLAEHIGSMTPPNTYHQKWFIGLGVNVLPFKTLYVFFDRFLEEGYPFLFRFFLSLTQRLEDAILAAKDHESLLALLRLDLSKKKVQDLVENASLDEIAEDIIAGVEDFDLSDVDFDSRRKDAYNKHIKPALEAANRNMNQEDEDSDVITFDSDEEDEEGEECEVCFERFPDYFCTQTNKMVCEECKSDVDERFLITMEEYHQRNQSNNEE
eukprot:gb/GECH01014163.1/.p1 GENE.gb/GECH01014163.1/~~gb/GECH01014163.1/.p1  ORF type:complete len:366 (+),score=124.89 gb/GECH01014163.1/:1-1098(+)